VPGVEGVSHIARLFSTVRIARLNSAGIMDASAFGASLVSLRRAQ
jgi:hypothetical protein